MSSIYGFLDPRNADRRVSNDLLDTMRDKLGHAPEDCLQSGISTPGCALGCTDNQALYTQEKISRLQ